MKTSSVLRHLLLFGAGAAVLLSGCARRENPVAIGNREQILHLGNLSEPKELDPHVVTGVTEFNILSALLEGLVAEDPQDLHPIPGAAEGWTVSEDGCQYTFRLRRDGKWSNGAPVTASDWIFSFKRILSPKLGSPYAYMLFGLTNAEAFHLGKIDDFSLVGAKAADDHTLVLTLHAPVPYFLPILAHHSWFPVHPATVLSAGAIDQIGTKWTQPGRFVGNGPFVLKAWEPQSRITVVKSDTYWDRDRVRLKEIDFHPIGDHQTEENAFRAGQLHVTGSVPIDRIEHYRKTAPERLRLSPYLGTYYYLLNAKVPPLNDPRVRRALALGIDREQLVRRVSKAGEDPAWNFTPPGTGGYTARARLQGDVEAARKLLAEAGFPEGKGFPRLKLLYNTSEGHERIAQAIQQMWKTRLGVDIELVNMEWKVYLAQTQEGKYEMARAGWIADYSDPATFLNLWVTDGGNNRTGWSNKDYDRLMAEADAARAPQERLEIFQKAEEILMNEVPIIPVYFYRSKALIQPSVKGWLPNLLDHHPYKYVYLEAESAKQGRL